MLITTWGGSAVRVGLVGRSSAWSCWPWWRWSSFGVVERRAPEPILSLALFRNRNFALVSVIGFLLGFAMFGAINFLPLYQQTVQGASATNCGLLLLPMMAGHDGRVADRRSADHPYRPVQDLPDHRRRRHDRRHDPAVH